MSVVADQRDEGAQERNRLPHDESADVDVPREVEEGGRRRAAGDHQQEGSRGQRSEGDRARVRK